MGLFGRKATEIDKAIAGAAISALIETAYDMGRIDAETEAVLSAELDADAVKVPEYDYVQGDSGVKVTAESYDSSCCGSCRCSSCISPQTGPVNDNVGYGPNPEYSEYAADGVEGNLIVRPDDPVTYRVLDAILQSIEEDFDGVAGDLTRLFAQQQETLAMVATLDDEVTALDNVVEELDQRTTDVELNCALQDDVSAIFDRLAEVEAKVARIKATALKKA